MRSVHRLKSLRFGLPHFTVTLSLALFALIVGGATLSAETTVALTPNSDPDYVALRNIAVGSEAVTVQNLVLKRDAGTFTLTSGTVCFLPAVRGKVTGAIFVGDGSFALTPPNTEATMLKLLSKEDDFKENYSQLVLRFTDNTYEEVKQAGKTTSGGCDAGLLRDSQHVMRHKVKENLDSRILEDLLSQRTAGLFVAFIHGKHYSNQELYRIDPDQGHDQVDFFTYDDNKAGDWASFPLSKRSEAIGTGYPIRIDHHDLDTTLEKNADLSGKAQTTFTSLRDGLRVVPFDLFHTLRVHSVSLADGQPLAFVQEDKNDDAEFSVILPKALALGEQLTIVTTYEGKEAVIDEGDGNYFPVARSNWYPNIRNGALGDFATYDMTFRIPKGMQVAVTGVRTSDSEEAGRNVTVWKSEGRQTVAGFSFGKFKVEEAQLDNPPFHVRSFANQNPPNWVQALQHATQGRMESGGGGMFGAMHEQPQVALGGMQTTLLNKKALAESELAVHLYTDFFGPSSFQNLQITQQTACNFGQSWPGLVWIPICYYFDNTVRHQLGMDWGDRGYWKVVTPHEVAHQWWGHTVGFNSYRDQWMSEGFSDLSASLFISMVEKNPAKFISFWNDERDLLLERNAEGYRAIDAGSLVMGYRTNNFRTGFGTTRRLIYPKGAYVLHMLRMMMHDRQTGDQQFKEMMQDFVKTYSGKSATTEDFKAVVEKHMTPEMDAEGNHKMDWFFNEYVYGTALPAYKVDAQFDNGPGGDVQLSIKLKQYNVDDKFRMLVPLYIETAEGNVIFLGRARLVGNTSVEQKVPLKGLKAKPRRAMVNYYDDVLASAS